MLDAAATRGVPTVSADTGKALQALVRDHAVTRVLEIGTGLGGSAIWMASALPVHGHLITLERLTDRAAGARAFVDQAGLTDRVNVMIGEASRFLHKIAGPFDLVFQDGDADQHPALSDRLLALLVPGGRLVTHQPDGSLHILIKDAAS